MQDHLHSGKLTEAETALQAALESDNADDRSRLELGLVQFGLALEHFLQGLNEHGFLTERTFGSLGDARLRQLFPDHPEPEVFSNAAFRELVKRWLSDIKRAEQTLAEITDPDVKLRIRPALIEIDPSGTGRTVSAAKLLDMLFPAAPQEQIAEFSLTFDRGDVHWLRGYLHLQAAIGELVLAHDFEDLVEVGAHRLFEKVDTPHTWLLEEDRKLEVGFGPGTILVVIDLVATLTQGLDVRVQEPERFQAALKHFEAATENGRQMWEHILKETDDDHEWIPNPQQTGAIGVRVNQEMIETWLETLRETQRILAGETLIPFWRDYIRLQTFGRRGINLRKVFENPPSRTAVVLWIQGTAATPYLEEGELTEFADAAFLERVGRVFGANFFGFAVWFN